MYIVLLISSLMNVGELAGELALPVKRNWNDVLGLNEQQQAHRTVLSHDYGAVTSISV